MGTAKRLIVTTVAIAIMCAVSVVGGSPASATAGPPIVDDFVQTTTVAGTLSASGYAGLFASHTAAPSGGPLRWTVESCSPSPSPLLSFTNNPTTTDGGSITLDSSHVGSVTCQYHVTDGQNQTSNTGSFTFTVTANPPAVHNFTEVVTVTPVNFVNNYSVVFGAHTDNPAASRTLVWTIESCSPPAEPQITFTNQPTNVASGGGLITRSHVVIGTATCDYHVTDQFGQVSNTATYTYTVTADPPVVHDFSRADPVTTGLSFVDTYRSAFSSHTDNPAGSRTLLWTIEACSPPGEPQLTFTSNPSDFAGGGGLVSRNTGSAGTGSCRYHVSDQFGQVSNTATYTYTVTAAPAAPTVQNQTVTEPVNPGHSAVVNYVGLLDQGATGTGNTYTMESCTPAGTVTFDNIAHQLTIDETTATTITCHFHATDSTSTNSNSATLTVIVADVGGVPAVTPAGLALAGSTAVLLLIGWLAIRRRDRDAA